jgi:hypothetical protein
VAFEPKAQPKHVFSQEFMDVDRHSSFGHALRKGTFLWVRFAGGLDIRTAFAVGNNRCLAGCSLDSISIPPLVTSIGDPCFARCPGLEDQTFEMRARDSLVVSEAEEEEGALESARPEDPTAASKCGFLL